MFLNAISTCGQIVILNCNSFSLATDLVSKLATFYEFGNFMLIRNTSILLAY